MALGYGMLFVMCIIAVVFSLKQKAYWSIPTACLIFLYSLLEFLLRKTDLLKNTTLCTLVERLNLLVLAGYTVLAAIKSENRKKSIFIAVSSMIACTFRYARKFHFDIFSQKIQEPGVDYLYIERKFSMLQSTTNFVVDVALLAIIYVIVMELGKPEKKGMNQSVT